MSYGRQRITNAVIGAAIKVHRAFGPGLFASVYKECLAAELISQGLYVEEEKPAPVYYDGRKLEVGYRIDLLVEKRIVVEVKAIEAFNDIHIAQVLTYLRLTNCRFGLLINFNVTRLTQGIKRIVNGYEPPSS